MHADRTNRFLLTLFGLLVFIVGGAGMAASTGAFGSGLSGHVLLGNPAGRYISQHGDWLWPAIAAVFLLLALACLRWILALLVSTDRVGDIIVGHETKQGSTIVQPAAVTDALTREISTYHGVDAARSRVIGDGRHPEIVLVVTPAASADLTALLRRIESEALAHVRQALGDPTMPIQFDLV